MEHVAELGHSYYLHHPLYPTLMLLQLFLFFFIHFYSFVCFLFYYRRYDRPRQSRGSLSIVLSVSYHSWCYWRSLSTTLFLYFVIIFCFLVSLPILFLTTPKRNSMLANTTKLHILSQPLSNAKCGVWCRRRAKHVEQLWLWAYSLCLNRHRNRLRWLSGGWKYVLSSTYLGFC